MPPPQGLMPFRIGNDICHVPRIVRVLKQQVKGPQFIQHILSPEELENPRTKSLLKCVLDPSPKPPKAEKYGISNAARFMAGRFAAKEAVTKAHPHRGLTWHGIIIRRLGVARAPRSTSDPLEDSVAGDGDDAVSGQTTKKGAGEAQDATSSEGQQEVDFSGPPLAFIKGDGDYEDTHVPVSISHDGDYASAVCIGYAQEPRRQTDSE
ncbi:hypothetical protein F5X99DRAFT_390525 [Biscogniauxia marginata]|nr:hypothetical protein F5X99DRAFT_390525 [Biscogniauxia marginata]